MTNAVSIAAATFAGLLLAVLLGMLFRRHIPEDRLDSDKKDSVKMAMGLIATMSALLLGLLVSSAKGTYDTCRKEVVQMAAKVAYLDRVLVLYGPDAAGARVALRSGVQEVVNNIWPGSRDAEVRFSPEAGTGNSVYEPLQDLAPQGDKQRALKSQALSVAAGLGQSIALLRMQAIPSISLPMLSVVVSWLFIIFFSFTFISPPGRTVTTALIASAFSVSGAVFLILELDNPFRGLIGLSSEPMLDALRHLAK